MAGHKYRTGPGGVRADRRSAALNPGSVLVAERVAGFYSTALPRHARGVLADLGCGTGPLRAAYEPLVTSAWLVDWPSSAHDTDLAVAADLDAGVPLRSASCDTVLASDVVEHLRHPAAFFGECHRLLGEGGRLVGNLPFMYWLHEEPHDYVRLTEHGLRALAGEAGFERVEVTVLAGGLDVVVDIVGKVVAPLPLVGAALARAIQSAWVAVMSVPAARRAHRRLERRFPLAYGFVAG